jgi:hypothetical protein
MISLVRGNNAYIRIPKNGISTFMELLFKHGYKEVNLFDTDLDISKLNIWGHITDPLKRHTRGISEYLEQNPDIDYKNPIVGKMLVSGMFDVHMYTIHHMLGPLIKYPITWIPLDATIKKFNQYPTEPELLTGNDLTNLYFQEQEFGFRVKDSDRRNTATEETVKVREYIDELKEIHKKEYADLVKNVLEADMILYHNTLINYYKKYSS